MGDPCVFLSRQTADSLGITAKYNKYILKGEIMCVFTSIYLVIEVGGIYAIYFQTNTAYYRSVSSAFIDYLLAGCMDGLIDGCIGPPM